MGAKPGKYQFVPNEKIPGQNQEASVVLERLLLSQEQINLFLTAFADIDADFSGFVRNDEFKDYFKIPAARVYDRLFGVFRNLRGHYHFLQFVCIIWNFLSREPNMFPALLFSMYCDPNTHTLNDAQLNELISSIHGEKYKEKKAGLKKFYLDTMTRMKKSSPPSALSIDEFINLIQSSSFVMAPILKVQHYIRKTLLGEQFWIDISKKRTASSEMNDNNFILKITGYSGSEKYAKENEVLNSIKSTKRKKSVVDAMKDVFKARRKIEPTATPSLVPPETKRKRKSVFKPRLTVKGADVTGTYRVVYSPGYEIKISGK